MSWCNPNESGMTSSGVQCPRLVLVVPGSEYHRQVRRMGVDGEALMERGRWLDAMPIVLDRDRLLGEFYD